jgi:2-C-methyl-D-erythritol 4-phosphate cytidylyltransferase
MEAREKKPAIIGLPNHAARVFSMGVHIHALMPAAGVGARSGLDLPKQYARLGNVPVIVHALRSVLADVRVERVWVVLAADDAHFQTQVLPGLGDLAGRVEVLRCGGASRSHTVANGLAAAALHDEDWVLVHDAARPCLPVDDLSRLIDTGLRDPVGAILAAPVADTLKRGDAHDRIVETVDRRALWSALTPQMFRRAALQDALARAHAAGVEPTDEAAAFEWIGERAALVAGSRRNLKITWADDFALASALLGAER